MISHDISQYVHVNLRIDQGNQNSHRLGGLLKIESWHETMKSQSSPKLDTSEIHRCTTCHLGFFCLKARHANRTRFLWRFARKKTPEGDE